MFCLSTHLLDGRWQLSGRLIHGHRFAIDDCTAVEGANLPREIKDQSPEKVILSLTPKEKEGQAGELHIDPNTDSSAHPFTEKANRQDIQMNDYCQVDGVWLAHTVEVTDTGSKRKTIGTLSDVQINQAIPAETFTTTPKTPKSGPQ